MSLIDILLIGLFNWLRWSKRQRRGDFIFSCFLLLWLQLLSSIRERPVGRRPWLGRIIQLALIISSVLGSLPLAGRVSHITGFCPLFLQIQFLNRRESFHSLVIQLLLCNLILNHLHAQLWHSNRMVFFIVLLAKLILTLSSHRKFPGNLWILQPLAALTRMREILTSLLFLLITFQLAMSNLPLS